MIYEKKYINQRLENTEHFGAKVPENTEHFGAKIPSILGRNTEHFGARPLCKLLSIRVLRSHFPPIIILIKDLIIFNYNKTEPKNCGIFGPVSLKNELHEAPNKIPSILGQTLPRICLTTRNKYIL